MSKYRRNERAEIIAGESVPLHSKNKSSASQAPGVERALAIIELLSQHQNGLTVSQIVEVLEYPRNSVFRITQTLNDHGYLYRDMDSKAFMLTKKFLALGNTAISDQNIKLKAIDILQSLRDETRETILMGVLSDVHGVIIEQVPASQPLKFTIDVGEHFSIHASALGKVTLAFLPEREKTQYIKRIVFKKYNDLTITNRTDFEEELRQINARGYAIDHGEEILGVHCLGAPVFDHHGYPIAAMSIIGPSQRLSENKFEEIGRLAVESAMRISRRLGYGG